MAINPLIALDEIGTSVWLDYIRRKLVASGEMQRMVDEDGLRGMTSNPTIFEKAISGSTDYDDQIRDLVNLGKEPLEIFQTLATEDIRGACDILRPLYDRLERQDGYVSIEVSPGAANDTEQSLNEAHDLWKLVDRPNVMIKIPGTAAGLPAIETLISEGINVNITLLFNVDNYAEVAERYMRGLERRLEANQSIGHVASVASFFVSRIDSAVDKSLQAKLDAATGPAAKEKLYALLGKAAIANAKLAYERFERIFRGSRWQKLADAGAMVQRPLWASTSTKNPDYRDVMYVEDLIGPNTVNTMPQATMMAFKDHGQVQPTLTGDLSEAHATLDQLRSVGIDLDQITHQLQVDGVRLFSESFEELMTAIEGQQSTILLGPQVSVTDALGKYQSEVDAELKRLADDQFVRRLWEKDASLWSAEESEQKSVRNALGWLNVVAQTQEQAGELEAFAKEINSEGFADAVVLGMGGSSLCPDVLTHTFPQEPGSPRLSILDTTDPDAVEALAGRIDPRKTLFIVSSKSGTTAEPLAFYHYFWSVTREAGVEDPGANFIAITDPGTPLEAEAKRQGFRRVFSGVPEIGGRYSALSNFGMVPAAIMGIDVRQLLRYAEMMVHATQPSVEPRENPGVRLGAILGVLARAGRDKLTLVVSEEIATFGGWVEQLIAESTGKSGTGIIPVDEEPLGSPENYGNDRVFVYVRLQSSADESTQEQTEKKLRALGEAGYPVISLEMKDRSTVGAEFFRWEIATATAGSILRINAFNQPNVQESKDNTNRLLKEYEEKGSLSEPQILLEANGIQVSGPSYQGSGVGDYVSAFLDEHVRVGSYVALMAYIQPTREHSLLLEKLRVAIRDRYRVATTSGYGPRFLHSTGQLHKGGPNEGVFIQFVAKGDSDTPIAGQAFSFGTLIAAQALGDFQALQQHGRPVVRINLVSGIDAGLSLLAGDLAGMPV